MKKLIVVAAAMVAMLISASAIAGLTDSLKKAVPTTSDVKSEATKAVLPAGDLSQIIVYKGEKAGTGTGIISLKLKVGEEVLVTAKGVDKDGREIAITPTWKGDKEYSITPLKDKPQTALVKALKPGNPLFLSATQTLKDGKKVQGEIMGEIK